MRTFFSRLLDVVFRQSRERRIADEIQAHLDLLADDYVTRGMSRRDAELAARKAFGGVDQVTERCRDQRAFRIVDDVARDAAIAVRLLTREPGFVAATACSLAIGIGASTAVFTIANGVLLRPPAGIADSGSLVDITRQADDERFGVHELSFPNFLDLRERATTIADICAYEPIAEAMSLTADGASAGAELVFGHNVTPNYFSVLGVTAAAGTLFDDRHPGATVVLSHRFWNRRFGADPSIVGRAIRVNGNPVTISGVAGTAFTGTSLVSTDLWVAMDMAPPPGSYLWQRGLFWALARARLKPGVSRESAAGEIDSIGRSLEREHPDTRGNRFSAAAVSSIPGNLSTPLAGLMTLIFAFVSLVLVAACANLAALLLARGTVRRREMAVRLALGSSRSQLIRQLLTETLLLFAVGGVIGLAVARGATTLLLSLLPALPVPLQLDLPIDVRVAAFTMVLSLVTAIAAGLVPALESAKTDVTSTLKHQNTAASSPSRLRHAFVVLQVACGIMLIVGAALFTRALQKAVAIDQGFEASSVQLADLDLSLAGYDANSAPALMERVIDALRGTPSIVDAAFAATAPDRGRLQLGTISPLDRAEQTVTADWNAVQPRYFSTLGIRLRNGRDFAVSDGAAAPAVAIISESAASRLWPGQDPIGKYVLHQPYAVRGRSSAARGRSDGAIERLIVGVVSDIRDANGRIRVQVYVPLAQNHVPRLTLIARSTSMETVAATVRTTIASADPDIPIVSLQTLESAIAVNALPRRLAAMISAALALVSLLLATVGVYGVTAYAAARQTKEIGIRMSLGATAPAIRILIARAALRLVLIGGAIGSVAAIAAARALQTSMSGFPGLDPSAFLAGLLIFCFTVVAASWIPAIRASRVDPMISLRQE